MQINNNIGKISEFYCFDFSFAPWCPACQSLTETWKTVATKMDFCKVATIDVTEHPGNEYKIIEKLF